MLGSCMTRVKCIILRQLDWNFHDILDAIVLTRCHGLKRWMEGRCLLARQGSSGSWRASNTSIFATKEAHAVIAKLGRLSRLSRISVPKAAIYRAVSQPKIP